MRDALNFLVKSSCNFKNRKVVFPLRSCNILFFTLIIIVAVKISVYHHYEQEYQLDQKVFYDRLHLLRSISEAEVSVGAVEVFVEVAEAVEAAANYWGRGALFRSPHRWHAAEVKSWQLVEIEAVD